VLAELRQRGAGEAGRGGAVRHARVTDLAAAFVKAAARRFYEREPGLRDLA
jgi:hypothetical protein